MTYKPSKVAPAKNFISSLKLLVQLASISDFILFDNWKVLLFFIRILHPLHLQ